MQSNTGVDTEQQIAHEHSQFLEQHSINPFEIYYEGEEEKPSIFFIEL